MNKKVLNNLLIIVFFIIIFETLNSIYLVKSIDLYVNNFKKLGIGFNEYVNIEMIKYFSSVSIFIIFSLYNYFSYNKLKINNLYKGVWLIFIIANILLKIFVFKSDSITYLLSIGLQIILVIYVLMIKGGE